MHNHSYCHLYHFVFNFIISLQEKDSMLTNILNMLLLYSIIYFCKWVDNFIHVNDIYISKNFILKFHVFTNVLK